MAIGLIKLYPTLFGSFEMGLVLSCLCAAACVYLVVFSLVAPRLNRTALSGEENDNTTVLIDNRSQRDGIVGISSILGTRPYQQDRVGSCVFRTDMGEAVLAVVCDGMGGMSHGERASEHCVTSMIRHFMTRTPGWADVPSELVRCVKQLDREVAAFGGGEKHKLGSGTTLIAACLRGRELYWVSVGDSRIYLYESGLVRMLTRDHNYALQLDVMVKKGMITRAEAEAKPRKDALISYVGMGNAPYIDANRAPLVLGEGSTVMLCSDGVTKLLSDSDIARILSYTENLEVNERAEEITKQASAKRVRSQDNTSAVIMKCRCEGEVVDG